jgi:hypothetical protein
VPGWWPQDPEGSEAQLPIAGALPESYDHAIVVHEGQEHLIPDDAEEVVVEMSDPWFLEQERKARQGA